LRGRKSFSGFSGFFFGAILGIPPQTTDNVTN
jgi:hypothetical protein